jgi:arylsulfatase A-like enzyme
LAKPNIILLTLDTLRPDRLGCYGFSPSITPHIDRLAEKSIIFSQAITGGSWTQAAFPVILTSTYASMYGGCLGPLSPDRPSPIQVFKDHGYTTAGFSTSPLLSRTYAYQKGFTDFFDLEPSEKDPWLRSVKGGQFLLRQPTTHHFTKLLNKPLRPAKLYVSAGNVVDGISNWISTHPRPFFVWAHFMDIHWPYHREEDLDSASDIAQAWRDLKHLHDVNWNGSEITIAQKEHYIRLYEKAVEYTDIQIGVLLDFLENNDLVEDTIIVLLADHGEEFMDHGRWGHWEDNLYDEVLRIPLIWHDRNQNQGITISQQVSTLDLMPTLLELCDCPLPNGLLGTSLAPLWRGESQEFNPKPTISEMWHDPWHIIAVRKDGYKLIWDNKKPDAPLLFNLSADPGESQSIGPQTPDKLKDLLTEVNQVLFIMEQTKPTEKVVAPDLDDEMVTRLRDLGYIR